MSSTLSFQKNCHILLTWGPGRSMVVVSSYCFHAERSFDFLYIYYAVKVKFRRFFILGFFIISVLRSPTLLPLKTIRKRTPRYRFGYPVCSGWPASGLCKLNKMTSIILLRCTYLNINTASKERKKGFRADNLVQLFRFLDANFSKLIYVISFSLGN